MRGSSAVILSVALRQQRIERARRLALAAFRAARLARWRPGEDVEMQPRWRFDEAAQEQRGGDGAALASGADIIKIGYLGFQHSLIGPPQRQTPNRIAFGCGV